MKPARAATTSATTSGTTIEWEAIYRRLDAAQQSIEQDGAPTVEQQQAILRARAKRMAQGPAVTTGGAPALEIVGFRMAHEMYGFESRYIREVYPLRDVCPLPCTPAFVIGLVNVRGRLISVLDLKQFFGLANQEIANHNQAIILHHGNMEVGILADALLDVRQVARDSLQMTLPTLAGLRQEFLLGISATQMIILDAERLLSSPEIMVYEEVEQ